MRIGIVGTGIAGLTASWLFRRAGFQVTLLEKHPSLGMGAHSKTINLGAKEITIDVPPRMFNASLWPQLTELYEDLNVEKLIAEPSKSYCNAEGESYLTLADSFTPQPSVKFALDSLFNSKVKTISKDALRLMEHANQLLADQGNELKQTTFIDFLRSNDYSSEFVYEFLFPALSSTVCTCSYKAIENYPAFTLLSSMLAISDQAGLYRTKFGTSDVVERLTRCEPAAPKPKIHLNTTVESVKQTGDLVQVKTQSEEFSFDHFVVATQANSALRLLAEVTEIEKEALGAFAYEDVETVVHSDASFLPAKQKDWSSFNFISNQDHSAAMCSIWMNRFTELDCELPIIQTILPFREPKPSTVLHRTRMQRPVVDLGTARRVERLKEINSQSDRRIWFCGSYAGDGVPLLEGGVTSSHSIANHIGALTAGLIG